HCRRLMDRTEDLPAVARKAMDDQRDIVPRRGLAQAGDVSLAGDVAKLRAMIVVDEDGEKSFLRRAKAKAAAVQVDLISEPGGMIENPSPGFALDVRMISK